MATKGVVCGYDGGYKSFDECIKCHENFKNTCHAPVELLKVMRDNHKRRGNAGWSATTLTGCPRASALMEVYDYYEPLVSGWNKARGEWVHAMMEAQDQDDPDEVLRERRLYKEIPVFGENVRITGQFDKVYRNQGVLIDFKSKSKLPKGPDIAHEFQFNIYSWLCDGGFDILTDEQYNIQITKGGMHYVTWETKEGLLWLKMAYPVWEKQKTEDLIYKRLVPLVEWKRTGLLPKCDSYVPAKYWKCDCQKIEDQLKDRGIDVTEYHDLTAMV